MNTSRHVCSSRQVAIGLGAGDPRLVDRREFLWRFGGGLGGIALIHLLGLDHQQLTFYHNGTERRLTDVHGEVIQEVLA